MDTATLELTSWVKLYTKEMYHYTHSKINDKQTAKDIVQITFMVAVESYAKFKHESNPKTWLYSILKHKIADYYRSKYKDNIEITSDIIDKGFDKNGSWKPDYRPTNWGNEKELLNDPEYSKALGYCFDKLPQKWSSAIRLKFLEELASKTICSKLKITTSNYWQIMHRAKLQLRNCLEIKWFKHNL